MKHPETHEVTAENGPRPAGLYDECFYCKQAIGQQHKADCPLRTKTVLVEYTVRAVIQIPESWDSDLFEFSRNEGSWCASNIVQELARFAGEDGMDECLCPWVEAKWLRDATEEEDKRWFPDGVQDK